MSGNKRHNRNHRDANEPPLIKLAEQLGAHWHEDGPLDGWLYYRGSWTPVEIKNPDVEGHAREYRPAQLRFFTRCKYIGARWLVWRTEDDVLRDLGVGAALEISSSALSYKNLMVCPLDIHRICVAAEIMLLYVCPRGLSELIAR